MSARWRRNRRNSNRFNIFKAFSRGKEKNASQASRPRKSKSKRLTYANRYTLPKKRAERNVRELEPLIDVLEEKDDVIVVAELAGFNKENLKIHVKNQRLTLSAESSDRKYHKSLNLPKRVIPSTIHTKYKNGVLEIQLKKVAEEKTIDKVAG